MTDMTQAPTPGPLSGDHEFNPDLSMAGEGYCMVCGRHQDDHAPTAPVEASGSERESLIQRLRNLDNGTASERSWVATYLCEEAANALAALRPQPSGETREEMMGGGDVIALVDPTRWNHPTAPQLAYANGWNDRPAPVASGGQHSSGEVAGCAEPQVGLAVYERIEKLLKTDPTGWERAYLCHLVESVEEVGGYDGPRLDGFPYRKAVAAFLKLRDESVGPGEADDEERLESADIILSLTTPVAETAGEAVGPDSFSAEGKFFLAVDHLTRMTWRWGESCGIDDVSWDKLGDTYNQTCRDDHLKARRAVTEAFHAAVAEKVSQAPVPAQDDDKLRIAVEALEDVEHLIKISPDVSADDFDRGARAARLQAFDIASAALSALKSTAAKEGGS